MIDCPACGKPRENVSDDPNQEEWECENARCLEAVYYKDAKCDKCSAVPIRIVRAPLQICTEFQCANGHFFTLYAMQMRRPTRYKKRVGK